MHNEITIGKALKLKSGKFLSAKNMITGNYQVYGGNGQIGCHNEYIFEDEKIIIGRVGAYCGNVHKTKPFSWITDNALYVDKKLFPFEDDYLVYLLKAKQLNKYASKSGQPLISFERIKKIKIPLPPLPIQKKIAEILDTADALKQKDKALITKYNELTQSLFLDMFGDPIINSKNWKTVNFKEVMVLKRGYDLPLDLRQEGDIPIIGSNGIVGYHNKSKVQGVGVITGRSGTLGRVHSSKCSFWPLNTALYSHDLKGNNYVYLKFFLSNFKLERFSRGVGVPTLNRNLVHEVNTMLPPIELQNEFAERVKIIEQQKQLAEQSLKKSEDLFNCLLQKAFKGELVS